MTIRATIERLRDLHEKATPEEWYAAETSVRARDRLKGISWALLEGYSNHHADAAFIAEAHSAMPALLEYIERLERVAEAARAFAGLSYPWHGSDPHRRLTQSLDSLDKP